MAVHSDETRELFSQRLERWLSQDEPKTLGTLSQAFGQRSFAVAILLLMLLPALPLPTGGVSHLFEAVSTLLAAEMIIGKRTVWIPARWRNRPLGALTTASAIPRITGWVRRVERFSKPRGAWLFHRRWAHSLLGVALAVFAISAALAPPFSGLDTLPAMGAVCICLAIVTEDVLLLGLGLLLGTGGIVVIIAVGATLYRLAGRLL